MWHSIPSATPLWSECAEGYSWPEEARAALQNGIGLTFDEVKLLELVRQNQTGEPLVLTFLTSEYLALGILWAEFARRSGNHHIAIAAMDTETTDALQAHGIPNFEVQMPSAAWQAARHWSRNGFDIKGLALLYYRTRLVRFLLEHNVDVVSCDVDALLEKPLDPRLTRDQMMACQRVAYFPKPLARVWGFTACAGFVAYRACSEVLTFLTRVLSIQEELCDDQVALNLALLEGNVTWDTGLTGFASKDEVIHHFSAHATRTIQGTLSDSKTTIAALPATTFWRHDFIPLNRDVSVLLHPNSPKLLDRKLDVFSRILQPGELACLQLP